MSANDTINETSGSETQRPRNLFMRVRSDFVLAMVALLYFLHPILRIPALEDSFISPKIGLAAFLLCTVFAGLLIRSLRSPLPPMRLGPQGWALLGFVTLSALSLSWAMSTSLGLHCLAYFLLWLLLYVACLFGLTDAAAVWVVMFVGMAAAAVTSVWTLLEDATHGGLFGRIVPRLPDWRGYLAAGLGNSGHIAGYLALFFPAMCAWLLWSERFPWRVLFAVAVTIPALIITWSVGSTGALIVALIVWSPVLLSREIRPYLHWRRLWWIVGLSAAWKAFYFLPHPWNPHRPSLLLEAFGSKRWAEGWPTRVAIWKTTLQMIAESPWLGCGVGNFTYSFVQQIVPSVVNDPQLRQWAGAYTNEAHNEYLQVWAEGGIIALVAYLAIFLGFYVRAHRLFWRTKELPSRLLVWSAAAGVTVFVLDSLMTFPLRLPSHVAVLMFFLAIPQIADRSVTAASAHAAFPRSVAERAVVALCLGLTLMVTVFHGRRMAAEFCLKQARAIAEAPVELPSGGVMSPWAAAEKAFEQGVEKLMQGDRSTAEKAFSAAQEIAQSPPLMLAETYFRKALEWDRRYSNASSRYGALLLMRGNYADAAAVLRQTLLDLESYEVHERLGFAYYFLGDYDAAAEEWTTCLLRRPILAEKYRRLVRLTQP